MAAVIFIAIYFTDVGLKILMKRPTFKKHFCSNAMLS